MSGGIVSGAQHLAPTENTFLRVRRGEHTLVLKGFEIESVDFGVTVSVVPGSTLSMAFVRGQVVPVLDLGTLRSHLLVGRSRGEVVALAGLEVLGFETAIDGSEPEEIFDVAEYFETLKSRVQKSR